MSIEARQVDGKSFFVVRNSRNDQPFFHSIDETSSIVNPESIVASVHKFLVEARNSALARVDQKRFPEAKDRVMAALGNRLAPLIEENLIIAEQIDSEIFRNYEQEITDFLGCIMGADLCPDGRIHIQAIADPRVLSVARTPMGAPKARSSTQDCGEPVLYDHDKAAAVETQILSRIKNGLNPELVQFGGIHIDSQSPLHGCGALKRAIEEMGLDPNFVMADGGITFFYDNQGDKLTAIENNARNVYDKEKDVRGKATFVDIAHDSHDESIIFGLRNAYKDYDTSKTLAENLRVMSKNKQILMTRDLDLLFEERIRSFAQLLKRPKLDAKNPYRFAETTMTLGRIAKRIVLEEEAYNFSWIPNSIKEGKSVSALRSIAYISIRNTAYRLLCGIEPGEHDLREHPEVVMTVGSTSPAFNRENIVLPLKIPKGPLIDADTETSSALLDLWTGFLRKSGKIDLEQEGRLVISTGEHTPEAFKNDDYALADLINTRMAVMNNAAIMRNLHKDEVDQGKLIVISGIQHSGTRGFLEFR